jgi:L-fuculose-phosphate aldolase
LKSWQSQKYHLSDCEKLGKWMSEAMTLATDVEAVVRDVTRDVMERLRAREKSVPASLASCCDAERLKAEMVRVGRKLWDREYVDGNGGNLSVRLTKDYVLCTATMVSKGDLVPSDICLCDMNGDIAAGDHARSSELLLHLEIYKANPRARAVVHCHPPHATAFAVTGTPPPVGILTEQEIFVGPVAMAPYETPGTPAFAKTVAPFVRHHNTILLQNHGIVCWADSLTHAEWLAEIFETYCRTILLARQTGLPLARIPEEKIQEILRLKQRLGFPDARLENCDGPEDEFQDFEPEFDRAEIEELVREAVGRHSY